MNSKSMVWLCGRLFGAALYSGAVACGIWLPTASGQASGPTKAFPLTDTAGLVLKNVAVKAVEYKGRKAVQVTVPAGEEGYAILPGVDFQDGTIEAEIALKATTPPGVRMPGFVGIAFRARPDASHCELLYLRPGNSHANDQAMRNHSVQYFAVPDFGWSKLRREWPYVYESHAEISFETWIHVKIEVRGREAKLFLNGSDSPSLVVNGLKGEDLRGAVALWGYQDEEAYFANVRVTSAPPEGIKNGSDAAGTWRAILAADTGGAAGTLKLVRDGNKLSGTWSGDIGDDLPVQGTWRNGYVELSFPCTWDKDTSQSTARLAGWVDRDAGQGRLEVVGRGDGTWKATRQ